MRKIAAGLVLLLGALSTFSRPAVAEADRTVVVSAGDQSLTVGELQARMNEVPLFQLRSFGKTPDEIRHGFVDKVIVPELLDAAEAARRKLDQAPGVQDRIKGVLTAAVSESVGKALPPVTSTDVVSYYAEHTASFNTPERIRISRILVHDKAEAERILAQVRQVTVGEMSWSQIARDKSVDRATAMREGNLGFVQPDGRTEVPRVRVDPALYDAASHVKDGEIVPDPVKEGDNWAVVWRRGSMPAVHRTADQERQAILHTLMRKRMSDAMDALIAKLRQEHVGDVNYKLLDFVDIDSFGDIASKTRPGTVPRERHHGKPVPEEHEQGYR